jgi:hypothetical protein
VLASACTPAPVELEPVWYGDGAVGEVPVAAKLVLSGALQGEALDHARTLIGPDPEGHRVYQAALTLYDDDEPLPTMLRETSGYLLWCGSEACGTSPRGRVWLGLDTASCAAGTVLGATYEGEANLEAMELGLDAVPDGCQLADALVLDLVE